MKKPNENGYRFFKTDADVQGYVESELLSTLRDDLDRMENEERQHYTNSDRKEMESRIADVETYFEKPNDLLEALKGLVGEIQLGKLNIRKDFSLINAHACASKAIAKAEGK